MRQFDFPNRCYSLHGAAARAICLGFSAAILSACGGSDSGTSATPQASAAAQGYSVTLAAPTAAAPSIAQPTFHLAPVILDEPADIDRGEPSRSAAVTARRAAVSPAFAQLSTRRLTPQVLEQLRDTGMAPEAALAEAGTTDPMAATGTVTIYTPAQIRAAYGLPVLTSSVSSVTSAQGAQLGAGQTMYLIDAQNDPNIAAELASFVTKFGLPGCTLTAIATSASLPLGKAPTTGCALSIVYSNPSGTMTTTAPAYDSGWATEIALDVQWAHATAPYARIILIEAPDASVSSLAAAVQLANQMGPGVVSQSFGAAEGGFTNEYDAIYSVANMTYLASAGDAGAQVNWPAVSSHVLAVAGTSLSYSGSAARTETVWSGTGGGVSAYTATPTYQSLAVPGLGAPTHRAVSDVTFNANPYTGQYLAVIAPGSTNVAWYSAGGTSLAAPQWAGIIAVANALRAQGALAPIGASQATLYGLAIHAASYGSAFLDVTAGSDGSCATCYAGAGYDLPSGLGSPNVSSLLTFLNTAPPTAAPIVTSATVAGKVGTALSFSITASDAHPLTYSLTSAPSGMSVNASTGLVSWSAPLLGTYSVIAHATDAQTGLSGQGTIGLSIVAPVPPQVTGGSVGGTAQSALSFAAQVTDSNAVTWSLSGAPSGMAVSAAGVVSWASPLAGTYEVTVIAHDATTGLSGQGRYTVTIAAVAAPSVPSESLTGSAGTALSACVKVNDTNPLTFSLTGAPSAMSIANSGCITWNAPTVGTFVMTVAAQDTKTGLTGKGVITLVVTQAGPVIMATSFAGIAGKALTGSITFTDSSAATSMVVHIAGAPTGVSFRGSGNAVLVTWASPVTGTYSLHVTATDNQKLTATVTLPMTITAH
jgi:hypothetical protein